MFLEDIFPKDAPHLEHKLMSVSELTPDKIIQLKKNPMSPPCLPCEPPTCLQRPPPLVIFCPLEISHPSGYNLLYESPSAIP